MGYVRGYAHTTLNFLRPSPPLPFVFLPVGLSCLSFSHQGVVGPPRDQNLVLLLHREVGVGEGRIDVLLVHVEDLVVADRPRVAEVVHSLHKKQRAIESSASEGGGGKRRDGTRNMADCALIVGVNALYMKRV